MTFRVLVTDKVNVAALDPLSGDGFDVIAVHDSSTAEFQDELAEASALIVRSATQVDENLLKKAAKLKAIGRAGVGVDNIDIDSATDRGIAVFNAPDGNTIAAAELTVGLILALARHIAAADASLRSGKWDRAAFKGFELNGKTLGLVGAGRIGSEVAKRCRSFAMDVLVYDPYLTEAQVAEFGGSLVDVETVLENADVVSVHVPLTDETRSMFNESALARMKDTAVLINASRGGVVDAAALASALTSGAIAGAALDVYEAEPLAADSPLRGAPNLVMTPHLGASTVEAQEKVATQVAEKVRALLSDGDLAGALNARSL